MKRKHVGQGSESDRCLFPSTDPTVLLGVMKALVSEVDSHRIPAEH